MSIISDLQWELIENPKGFVGYTTEFGNYRARLFIVENYTSSFLNTPAISEFDSNEYDFNLTILYNDKPILDSGYEILFGYLIENIQLFIADDYDKHFLRRLSKESVIKVLTKLQNDFGNASVNNVKDYSTYPCSVCGMKDKWNNIKNDKVVCYQHC